MTVPNPAAQTPAEQPQGWWAKTKLAVRGFVTSAIAAVPRILLFSGAIYGASYAAGHFIDPNWDILQIRNLSAGDMAGKLVAAVALGSAISGAVGAFQCVRCGGVSPQPSPAPAGQARAPSQTPTIQIAHDEPSVPAGLPRMPQNRPNLPGFSG